MLWTPTNADVVTQPRGAVVRRGAAGTVVMAQANTGANCADIVGARSSSVLAGGSGHVFPCTPGMEVIMLMEPAVGDPIYLSDETAGHCTNVRPAIDVCLGVCYEKAQESGIWYAAVVPPPAGARGDVGERLLPTTHITTPTNTINLPCSALEYNQIRIVINNLLRPSIQAFLTADGTEGKQSRWIGNSAGQVTTEHGARVRLTRPTAGVSLDTIATGTNPQAMVVSGNVAFVANTGSNTIQALDISDPSSLSLLGTVSTGGGSAPLGLFVLGSILYVVNYSAATLQAFDVSNPATMFSLGTVSTGASSGPHGVTVIGTTAFVVCAEDSTLKSFDVSNPAAMTLLDSEAVSGNTPQALVISGSVAFVAISDYNVTPSRLEAFDISNPAALTSLGYIDTGNYALNIALSGNTAFVVCFDALEQGLQAYDVSNPAAMTLISSVTTTQSTQDIVIVGNTAYVINYADSTLRAYDISNPAAMVDLGIVATGVLPYVVKSGGNSVFVTNKTDRTLQSFDVSTASSIVIDLWAQDGGWAYELIGSTNYTSWVGKGTLPMWLSDLTITSLDPDAEGLMVGGTIDIVGYRLP